MNSDRSTERTALTLDELLAYVESRLSPEDHASVKAFIAQNPLYEEALAELREQAQTPESIQELREQTSQLGQHINRIEQEIHTIPVPAEPTNPLFSWLNALWVNIREYFNPIHFRQYPAFQIPAAIVLIGLAVWSWQAMQPPTYQELAESYITHFDDWSVKLSKDLEEQAIAHYQNREYAEAIPLFEKLVENDAVPEKRIRFRMFLGVSLLHEHRASEAVPQFETIINGDENNYQNPARWYLGLALLEQALPDDASQHLKWLAEHPGKDDESKRYSRQAIELLEKMKKAAQ